MDRLIVAALATWRLSSLLLYESGPFGVFMHLRSQAAWTSFTAQLFSCMYCMSVWVGLLCAVLMLTEYRVVLLPFALSAVAILVDQCSKRLSK
jgi:hypothetical protein